MHMSLIEDLCKLRLKATKMWAVEIAVPLVTQGTVRPRQVRSGVSRRINKHLAQLCWTLQTINNHLAEAFAQPCGK